MLNRIYLMGFEFVSDEFSHVIAEIKEHEYASTGFIPFLITPNADQVLQFNQKPDLKLFYEKAYFILPDGFPIILYSKLKKKPLLKRLPGSDLFPRVWDMIIKERKRVFIICPTDRVGQMLLLENQSLRYHTPGYLNLDDSTSFVQEADLIISKIENELPEYIIIGLGFPKQEILSKLIYERIGKQPTPLFMLLGASFEFYLQIKKRAPRWIQKLGFEWLHRLAQEPKRLWRRYTIGNIKFIIFFVKELVKQR